MSISCIKSEINNEHKLSGLSAKNGKLMYEELKNSDILVKELELYLFDNDEKFKQLPNVLAKYFPEYDEPMHNHFKLLNEENLPNMEKQYFDDDVIVLMSIMDKRWNNNDEIWNDILKYLNELK